VLPISCGQLFRVCHSENSQNLGDSWPWLCPSARWRISVASRGVSKGLLRFLYWNGEKARPFFDRGRTSAGATLGKSTLPSWPEAAKLPDARSERPRGRLEGLRARAHRRTSVCLEHAVLLWYAQFLTPTSVFGGA